MSRRRAVFGGALILGGGCATAGGPSGSGPYVFADGGYTDGSVSEAASGAGPGGSSSAGAGGSGGTAGALGGSGTGGGADAMGCSPTFCANDGTGAPCCVRPEGPCGMDRGSGCQEVPTGTGGTGVGGSGGGGTGRCTYCVGTCSTITEDARCYVDCIANQSKKGCIWQNKTCQCT